jgi:hypothetical protein
MGRDLTPKMAAAHQADLTARREQRTREAAIEISRYEQSWARLMDLYHAQAIREDWKRCNPPWTFFKINLN